MLQLRNITKIYKNGSSSVVALNDVSIDFPEKGLVFIVGKSGAGKSTLLNILGGLDKMDSGEVIINGRSTNDFSSGDLDAYRNYHIGFIFQEFNLLEDITVKENIALALKIQSKGHDETTIDEVLKIVNLEGLGYRSPKELSGGQKQRIAVARALVKNPDIILADEPTGALDSKTGYDLMNALKSLANDKLIIVVTHDAEMANVFGDEIIKLNDGIVMDHMVVSKNYIKPSNDIIRNNIIKINSGKQIENKHLINAALKENEVNYVCLTSQPELITVAYPEIYDDIFKKEDLSSKFVSKERLVSDVYKTKEKTKSKNKARIKFKECLKMAFNQFANAKSKLVLLLVFTIVAFSLLGFAGLFFTINDSNIISNTLNNNDLQLAIMEKYSGDKKEFFAEESLDELTKLDDDIEYRLSKQIDIKYTMSAGQSNSPFEMRYFRGIVECNDISSLNLSLIAGKGTFNVDSLINNEIIISDYAAFELRRTGYLGLDTNNIYGIVKPNSLQEQINTCILIGDAQYKIVGVFKTNYESFLPLLVSETFVAGESSQISSLNALKTYYYARIFAPKGFYAKFASMNTSELAQFKVKVRNVPVYEFANDGELSSDYKNQNLESEKLSTMPTYNDFLSYFGNTFTTIYGNFPNKLNENEIIVSYDWLRLKIGITAKEQVEKAIEAINNNLLIDQIDSVGTSTTVFNSAVKVVAVVDVDEKNYNDTLYPIVCSSEFSNKINGTLFTFDQVVFTTNSSVNKNINMINKFYNNNYRVLNIDGQVPTDTLDINTFKTIAIIAATVVFVFALLFMFNYVSSNIKKRKKEIGILRATGARGQDVVKMFAIEQGILAIVVSVVSSIIILYAVSIVNQTFGNIDIGINIITINIVHILIFVLFTLLFFVLTTIIPVMSIAKMKPIDAIRKI